MSEKPNLKKTYSQFKLPMGKPPKEYDTEAGHQYLKSPTPTSDSYVKRHPYIDNKVNRLWERDSFEKNPSKRFNKKQKPTLT